MDEIAEKLGLGQRAHYACAERYQRLHRFVGLSAVVLTTISSTFIFFNDSQFIALYSIVGPIVGILASVLVAIQTFSRYLEHYEAHRTAAVRYGTLLRYLKYDENIQLEKILDDSRRIAEASPVTPLSIREQLRKPRMETKN